MDFIRFYQTNVKPMLNVGVRYYFSVVGSAFITSGVLQLVFELSDGSSEKCMLLQEFEIGKQRFEDIITRLYDLELSEARVVEVTASDFLCWNGHCYLCIGSDGTLEVDLDTVEDFELPLSALYEA